MRPAIRRGLFWQVYLTLLASLVLVSLLGAVIIHVVMRAPPPFASPMRPHMRASPGVHALEVLLTLAAIVAIAAYPVMSRITARLEALRRSVEAWGDGDLARRADVDGSDEIAAVAASFNTAADRADALLAAHGVLLANASHELRSPLARLAMAVEMYAGGGEPGLAARIRAEIAELDAIVGEILLSSRLDHGPGDTDFDRVDCLALAAEEAARAGVALRAVPDPSPRFEVTGSSRLLRRMIRNLIDNALRHGAPPIEVALEPLSSARGPVVSLRVIDHGQGIPESLRDKVFEPFFRPEGRAEEGGGWGLGLSLVRQIARRHGGSVRVETAAGETRFVVEVPAAAALLARGPRALG